MRKQLAIIMIVLTAFILCGCCLSHEWVEATCTEPKTCAKCGKTEGEPLGHTWEDATCTTPKTCSRCGAVEGEALGHKWREASCTTPKTCTVCKETEGNALGHTAGEWTPVDDTVIGGEEVLRCTRCREVLDKMVPERGIREPVTVLTANGITMGKKEFYEYLIDFLPKAYTIKNDKICYNGAEAVSISAFDSKYIHFLESGSCRRLRELAPYLVAAIDPDLKQSSAKYKEALNRIDTRLYGKDESMKIIPLSIGCCVAAYTPLDRTMYELYNIRMGDNYHLLFSTWKEALGL